MFVDSPFFKMGKTSTSFKMAGKTFSVVCIGSFGTLHLFLFDSSQQICVV